MEPHQRMQFHDAIFSGMAKILIMFELINDRIKLVCNTWIH